MGFLFKISFMNIDTNSIRYFFISMLSVLFFLFGDEAKAQRIPSINFILTNALCEQEETDAYNRVGMTMMSSSTRRLLADPNEVLIADMYRHFPKKFDANITGYGEVSIGRHRKGAVNTNSQRIASQLRTLGVYQNVLDRIMIPWEKKIGRAHV